MALVPFVKVPSAAPGLGNGAVEGGVALPTQINLAAGLIGTTIPPPAGSPPNAVIQLLGMQ